MSEQSSKKYIQIADRIMDEIGQGTWKEGEAIPTVRALAEMYEVSPQTANKATSHLAGLGIIASRQGSGSVVTGKKSRTSGPEIPMLIDKARSSYLRGENTAVGYHGKELYLNYLHEMNEEGREPSLIVYDKKDTRVSDDTRARLSASRGVLIQGSLPDCYMEYIEDQDIPAVVINRTIPEHFRGWIGSVVMENTGLEQLSAYMASLGHMNFIYASSDEFEKTTVNQNRLDIIRRSLADSSRSSKPEVTEFSFTPGSLEDAARLRDLIDRGVSAVFCFNDICALRVYDLLHLEGLRIPDEVSVCGFDDMFMAEIAAPPLTTVKVNRTMLFSSSLQLLKDLMSEQTPCVVTRTVPTNLVIRRSCWQKPS